MEYAQIAAGVLGTPRTASTASAWDTGPNGLGEKIVKPRASASSRYIRPRHAWHQSGPKKAPKRKRGNAVYATAPYYHQWPWGPIPAPKGNAHTSAFRLHGRVDRQELLHVPSRTPWDGPLNDPERQALYARVTKECGADKARADVVLTFRLRRTPLTRAQIAANNFHVARALLAWAWPRGVKRPAGGKLTTLRPQMHRKIETRGIWPVFAAMALRPMRQAPLREAA